jgi:hypothetical protein
MLYNRGVCAVVHNKAQQWYDTSYKMCYAPACMHMYKHTYSHNALTHTHMYPFAALLLHLVIHIMHAHACTHEKAHTYK